MSGTGQVVCGRGWLSGVSQLAVCCCLGQVRLSVDTEPVAERCLGQARLSEDVDGAV